MELNSNFNKETNSSTNVSQTKEIQGDVLENNLRETFYGLFNCEEILDSNKRKYEFKLLLISNVEGNQFYFKYKK